MRRREVDVLHADGALEAAHVVEEARELVVATREAQGDRQLHEVLRGLFGTRLNQAHLEPAHLCEPVEVPEERGDLGVSGQHPEVRAVQAFAAGELFAELDVLALTTLGGLAIGLERGVAVVRGRQILGDGLMEREVVDRPNHHADACPDGDLARKGEGPEGEVRSDATGGLGGVGLGVGCHVSSSRWQ